MSASGTKRMSAFGRKDNCDYRPECSLAFSATPVTLAWTDFARCPHERAIGDLKNCRNQRENGLTVTRHQLLKDSLPNRGRSPPGSSAPGWMYMTRSRHVPVAEPSRILVAIAQRRIRKWRRTASCVGSVFLQAAWRALAQERQRPILHHRD